MLFELHEPTWTWTPIEDQGEIDRYKEFPAPYRLETIEGNSYVSSREIYNIAFVGKGSSIAYYLETLGAPYLRPLKKTKLHGTAKPVRPMRTAYGIAKCPGVLFGCVDAWDKQVRGGGLINHERHQIGHWGTQVPRFDDRYVKRSDFARENRAIFERADGVDILAVEIAKIEQTGDIFRLSTTQGHIFRALKVVVGSGAGPHERPDTMHDLEGTAGQVLDLDEFMRRCPRPGHEDDLAGEPLGLHDGAVVVVNGANAGIDAVERAAAAGYQVVWLIGSTKPQILPGNRLDYAPELAETAISVHYDTVIERGESGIVVRYVRREIGARKIPAPTPRGEKSTPERVQQHPNVETINAAIYVFAVGQDPMAKGAVGDVLITKGEIPWTSLEPIYDMNQAFGEPYQTVLGLRTKGTCHSSGLEIIGAAATSLTREAGGELRHNFIEQLPEGTDVRQPLTLRAEAEGKALARQTDLGQLTESQRKQRTRYLQRQLAQRARAYLEGKSIESLLNRVVENEVASVVLMAQLVGLKASIAAINGMIPAYVAEKNGSNFNIDNRTMLRVYLAHRYPDMEEEHAQRWIEYITTHRRSNNHPLGFDESWTELFERWFQVWDDFGRRYG